MENKDQFNGLQTVRLKVNGEERELQLSPWVSLLDALREHLYLTGTKKVVTMDNAVPAPFFGRISRIVKNLSYSCKLLFTTIK